MGILSFNKDSILYIIIYEIDKFLNIKENKKDFIDFLIYLKELE